MYNFALLAVVLDKEYLQKLLILMQEIFQKYSECLKFCKNEIPQSELFQKYGSDKTHTLAYLTKCSPQNF